jgi:hypothetical protein
LPPEITTPIENLKSFLDHLFPFFKYSSDRIWREVLRSRTVKRGIVALSSASSGGIVGVIIALRKRNPEIPLDLDIYLDGPSSTSTIPTTTSSTSTSAGGGGGKVSDVVPKPTSTEKPERYLILTHDGISLTQFKTLTIKLDGGEGIIVSFSSSPHHSYLTWQKPSQRQKLKTDNPEIHVILLNSPPEGMLVEFGAISMKRQTPNLPQRSITGQSNSPDQLKVLSQPPANAANRRAATGTSKPEMPDFIFDSKAGEGTTVFIFDSGMNPYHEVSSPNSSCI